MNHFNAIVLSDLKLEDGVIPGAIRKHSVGVGRYRGAAAAHLLSNHYNLTRAEYYRQLDYASKSGGDVIPFKEIRRVSPRIAELYAGKTERAIRRDVNDLLEMDLVKRSPKGFEANRQKIRAFLPPRKVN